MTLTKGERRLLQKMVDEEEELVFGRGGGWYCGNDRTSGRVAWSLIRKMLIRSDQYLDDDSYAVWDINESGRLALTGETKIYRTGDGRMFETIEDLQAEAGARNGTENGAA